jgi:ATP-binding cassette subfamily B protein
MGMGRKVEKPKDAKTATRRLLGLLAPHRNALLLIFALALAGSLFGVLGPKILGDATTLIVNGMGQGAVDFGALGRLLLFLLGLYVLSSVFGWLQQYLMAVVSQKVVTGLRTRVHGKLGRLPLKFYDKHSHGDVLSRVTNDVDTVASTLQQSLTQVVTSAISLVGTLAMMVWISGLLTLVALVVMPLVLVVVGAVTKRSRKHFADQQKHLGELSGHVEEMVSGHAEVQAFGREEASVAAFDEINARLYNAGWRAQFLSGVMMPLMNLVNNLGYVAVCVVGGLLAGGRGGLTVGDIQAFLMYLRQFGMPLAQTAGAANVFQSTLAAAERIFALLDEEEEAADPAQPVDLPAPRGELAIEGLHFRYVADRPLLEDLNLQVEPGKVVAIVGATGAGKTTLVNLLMRFYDLDAGRILLDGHDILTLTRSGLRRNFGMVLQDTWLFEGTIRENLAFGRPGATDEEIHAAAVAAHADHFIRTLPEGYETKLGEDAQTLSQGQLQLLTIARALLADPAVLILDEATSSVDTRTERALQNAMKTLMKGRTSFVIAHRLSTIRDADTILVMDKGQVVEQGRHDDLLAAGSVYAALYQSQFAGPAEAG